MKELNVKFSNFDYLRIIAAGLIVCHHYQQVFDCRFENGINFYGGAIPFGYLVELFFILSGFLTVHSWKQGFTLKANVKKKLLRIWPYAFIATAVYALEFIMFRLVTGTDLMDKSFTVPNYIASLFLVHQGWIVEFVPAVNNPTWYLCVLLLMYLAYYIVDEIAKFYLNNSLKYKMVAYFGFVILGVVGMKLRWDYPFLHMSNCRGLTAFFLGVIIYHVYNYFIKRKPFVLFVIAGILLGVFVGYFFYKRSITWLACVCFACPSVLIILASIKQIHNQFADFLGRISFEVYLWHAPCFYSFYIVFDALNLDMKHGYIEMIIFIIAIECVSILIYKNIDCKIDAMLKKL